MDDFNDRFCENKSEKFIEALDNFLRAAEKDPTNSYILSNIGFILERIEHIPELKKKAIQFHERAHHLTPGSPSILNGYARYLSLQGNSSDFKTALAYFDKALRLEPGNCALLKNKGILLVKMEKKKEAIACLEQALSINPKDQEAIEALVKASELNAKKFSKANLSFLVKNIFYTATSFPNGSL